MKNEVGFGLGVNVGSAGFSLFDDASSNEPDLLQNAVDNISMRELQSLIEQARWAGLNIVTGLLETISNEDYADDELPSDVLDGLIIEATEDTDDPDSDEENTFYDLLAGAIADALDSLGVDESVINDIFQDDSEVSDTAIEDAVTTALSNLPDDGDELEAFVRDFVFGESDAEVSEFDSITGKKKARNGATTVRKVGGRKIAYKGTLAVRHGKKVVVNKRIGTQKLRLSAKQKGAIKKARLKAFTGNAMRSRIRSVAKGNRIGIYK